MKTSKKMKKSKVIVFCAIEKTRELNNEIDLLNCTILDIAKHFFSRS